MYALVMHYYALYYYERTLLPLSSTLVGSGMHYIYIYYTTLGVCILAVAGVLLYSLVQ